MHQPASRAALLASATADEFIRAIRDTEAPRA
jgi:hypothetical protein